MKTILLSCLMLVLSHCYGQNNSSAQQERMHPSPKKAAKGTYQFIYTENDSTSIFTDDLLVIIESLRDKEKVIYYDASPTVKVKILPLVEINRNGFRPVREWEVEKE